MTPRSAKKIALKICMKEFMPNLHQGAIPAYHFVEVEMAPWYQDIGLQLKYLSHAFTILVTVFMSILLQFVGKKPDTIHFDSVNWFYVAAACLGGTLLAAWAFADKPVVTWNREPSHPWPRA